MTFGSKTYVRTCARAARNHEAAEGLESNFKGGKILLVAKDASEHSTNILRDLQNIVGSFFINLALVTSKEIIEPTNVVRDLGVS